MFGKTKQPTETMYTQTALIAICASVDEIDRHECSSEAIGSCLMTVLGKMGYSTEDALCGSIEATRHLDTSFQALYWKENSFSNRVAVFMSTLEATKALIERGLINETTRQKVKETLREQDSNTSDK